MSYPEQLGYNDLGPSKEAAIAKRDSARSECTGILAILKSIYPRGLTVPEIAAHMGRDYRDIAKRVSDLHRLNEVIQTGERRTGRRGRPVHSWRAVAAE